ncbi:phage tail protein [Lactobacillus paracasei]|uniref:phage tail protein n=1 Tax=Lacticaseibacillus paracasei TaxID=1597 RepID=UPI000D36261E|nr:phage tail protein [Lacticaseibacillus paracasei]PTS56340.1 phage tail protein [Lactobacillus sp. DS22_6]MCZ2751442.1 phage tail protein [Lacticaseibacillus paracasei]MCZ2761937.1 phage tail protein [Lacticaseibacillus paracasei]MCZ2770358.1 phage tail protein [Lacticaseibacillus paracasei]MDB7805500.1 phage tail protein [Lacticaseibacillus paracasei]
MKDFYFVDRSSWHLLGIATAGGGGKIHIVDDTDDQLISAGARTYSGTIRFTPELSSKVQAMAARGNYILYMDERNKAVFMTIMESSHDPLAGEDTFTAEDAGIDLINETVGPYKAPQAMGIADYISLFTNDSGFEIGLNEIPNLKRTLEWTGESDTTLNRILSVATQFDNAELDFSFDVSGTTVVRRLINIHQRIGADRNITLYVDKDINKIVTSGSIYDLYTAVTPTGGTPESKDGETVDQHPITLEGYQWTDPDGRYVLTKEGVLLDPVANQTWSRLLAKGGAPSVNAAYINRVVTYTATSQASLLQSALSDLKAHNHEAVNYETDIAVLPKNINIGDTIHLADENEQLYLSARLLELKSSYSMDTHTATLGDYLIEHDQVAAQYRQLAEKIKNLPKTVQYYTWVRYADDDKGTNMSAFPSGKKYMAFVTNVKSSVPSDNPADYAGKWALIKGADGADGVPGAKGADGRTSYFHTAWADDVSGQSGFTVSGGDGKKYIGTYSDFTQADSTNPSDYNWALFKGADGKDGYTPIKGTDYFDGKDGQDGKSSYLWIRYSKNADGTEMTSDPTGAKYVGYATTQTAIAPTLASAYKWQLVAGKDGIAGEKGADGKTSYLHIRYSNDGGQTFTTNSGETVGAYIGQYTDFTQSDSNSVSAYKWALIKGDKGDTGKDGVAGKDGIGIKSTAITYALGDSGTATPTTGWTTSVPSLIKGKYLWTKTVWLYTDNTSESGYSTTYIGKDGNNGNDGLAGKDGVGISATKVEYVGSTSGTNKPTSGWLTTVPSVAAGSFLWTKTTWSYTDGTSESGYSVAKMGEKGDQGIKGPSGADGKTPYFHIAYADSSDGKTNFSLDTPGSRKYIGSYTDFTQADSTNPAVYSWQLVQGPKGDTGVGIPGPKGADGKTSYFHTAYANSIDGSQGFSTTDGNGKSYFGQYVDQTQADSTDPTKYSWALFKGTDGRDGKDGSDNVPVITVGAAYPSGPKKGDMHWLTDSSGVVTGYYTYDGTKWNPYKIDAKILSAETFNGMTFNGVTFTGSKFISSFKGIKPDGVADYTVHGTTTMADGKIVTDTYSDTDNSQVTHTELSQFGLLSQIYNKGTLMDSAQLSLGMLTLSGNYQTASNKPLEWITSSLDALRVLQLTNNNLLVWHGAFYPAQADTATISTPLSKTLSGWLIAWSYYQNGSPTYNNYAFTLLPKAALIYNTTGANYLRVTFTMKNVGTIFKVIWYDDTHIIGADENKGGSLAQAVMTEVYAV